MRLFASALLAAGIGLAQAIPVTISTGSGKLQGVGQDEVMSFKGIVGSPRNVQASPVTISTGSGTLQGVDQDGVMSFKGIRFAQPPTGNLRWEPPVAFNSTSPQNATTLGPACLQQFAFATDPSLIEFLFNNPAAPPEESEDCLFLNVWAPSPATPDALKPVVVWIYGGSLEFGTASLPEYDGTSIASNQDILVVTLNYRTNVFGFPGSPDLPLAGNNLGFLDQELAIQWVKLNIEQFGGDPDKVTIMGQSAGGLSVSALVVRHPVDPPFRAAIIFSGAAPDALPPSAASFAAFNNFSAAFGCDQPIGPSRLACLRQIPAEKIRAFTNGPQSGLFTSIVDGVTTFPDNLERIRAGNAARVPLLAGNTQDDGSLFVLGETNLTLFLELSPLGAAGISISPDQVRALYPGQNDTQIIADAFRDPAFLCPASLWTQAFVQSGISSVFRYEYGPVFQDLQLFPNAGAWHTTELPELFGTFNRSTATQDEVTLSNTFQTAIANFIKDPDSSPAPNWPKYVPGNNTQTLARLAYQGNVETDNFVQAVQSASVDGPCAFWNSFLDPLGSA